MNSILLIERIKISKMSSQIDLRTLPANVPVMCIPRVYANITESRIRKIFDDLNMGTIDHIDLVSVKGSEKAAKFNRVFVHLRNWNDSENSRIARERLLNGKEIKIIYDDPWFWKISAYREPERRQAVTRPEGERKAVLMFDSDDEEKPTDDRRPTDNRRPEDRRRQEDRRPEDRGRQEDSRRHPEDRRRQEDRRPENRRHPEDRRRPEDRRHHEDRRRPDERRKKLIVCDDEKVLPSTEKQTIAGDSVDLYPNDGKKVAYGDVSGPFAKKKKEQEELEEGEVVEEK